MLNGEKQLPDGWEWTTLGKLANYINGRAFKPTDWETTGRPIIRIQNLTGSTDTVNRFSGEVEPKYIIRDGDLLISWSATLGAFIYKGEEAVLNQHIFKVEPFVNKKFLYYLVTAFLDTLKRQVHGSGMQHITKGKFNNSPVPLPPPDEQERIVAKIEELFTQLEAGTSALKRVQAGLRRYKRSVLKAAAKGQLFGKVELSDDSLPVHWKCIKVREAGKVQLGRQRSPKHHQGTHMRPYLRVANVFEDRIDLSDVKEMNFTPAEYEIYKLEYGDILLNEGQSPEFLGRPAMYKGELPSSCFQNTLIRFQAFDFVDRNFALLVFRHYMHAGRFAQESQITTNMAHLSAGRFGNVEFPLPPLDEQRQIVAEVERRLSVARQVENSVEEALVRAARLRQSILRHAFEGKLL